MNAGMNKVEQYGEKVVKVTDIFIAEKSLALTRNDCNLAAGVELKNVLDTFIFRLKKLFFLRKQDKKKEFLLFTKI